MNGQPLCVGGRYAAIRRIAADGEVRNNVHAGGRVEPVEVTEEMLGLVEAVRPKLVKDGMFLVGLDMVGNKLMEVNVFTPGGLHAISEVYGVDFARAVIEALERKTCVRRNYRTSIDNVDLATL
jgi:glutathione synthase